MMRHKRKRNLTIGGLAGSILLLWALVPGSSAAASIVTKIVTNPLTGIAIDGFDPVSYFTEPEPLPGKSEYEFYWSGVPWFFTTQANRDVFVGAPEIYAPQFGGHGAMALARGYLSDGNPRAYAVIDGKLYFFYSTGNRSAFLLSPGEAIAKAEANWATLSKELSER